MNGADAGRTATGRGAKQTSNSKPLPETMFEAACRASPEQVFGLLADLQSHLEWAGERQSPTTRLLTMEAPAGQARVGTEFQTTGSDGKVARWADRSVVTEATPSRAFEFVTDGVRHGRPGRTPMEATTVHRYETSSAGEGCRVTYRGQITRHAGFPAIVRVPFIGRLLVAYSAKYMRRGFDGLVAVAEMRAGV